jgi:hypothetical protein
MTILFIKLFVNEIICCIGMYLLIFSFGDDDIYFVATFMIANWS